MLTLSLMGALAWAGERCEDPLLHVQNAEQAAISDERERFDEAKASAISALGCAPLTLDGTRAALARLWNAEAALMIYASEDPTFVGFFYAAALELDPTVWTEGYPQKMAERRQEAKESAADWPRVTLTVERAPPSGTLRIDGEVVDTPAELGLGPHLVEIGWEGEAVSFAEVVVVTSDLVMANPLPEPWDTELPKAKQAELRRAAWESWVLDQKTRAVAARSTFVTWREESSQRREDNQSSRREARAAKVKVVPEEPMLSPMVSVGVGSLIASSAIAGTYGDQGEWAPPDEFGGMQARAGASLRFHIHPFAEPELGLETHSMSSGSANLLLVASYLGWGVRLGAWQLTPGLRLALVPGGTVTSSLDVKQFLRMCADQGTPDAVCEQVAADPENLEEVEWTSEGGKLPGASVSVRRQLVETRPGTLHAQLDSGVYFDPHRNYPWVTLSVTWAF